MLSLRLGDAADVLRAIGDESVDALVTDPPAGIGFMGKDWDHDKGGMSEWTAWLAGIMRECHRVLKPGAHGLVWALPRTSHWTAMALEDAGFEIRDCVTHLFGTGFPKSLDVSKAIDKAAGAEREILGPDPNQAGRKRNAGIVAGQARYDTEEAERVAYITTPATAAARQWSGWGTALKPAAEFWWLVRKPLGEKTVAANVLRHGTGAINVDGCRIAIVSGDSIHAKNPHTINRSGSWPTSGGPGSCRYSVPSGRFPANLILSCCGSDPHDDGCAVGALDKQCEGTRSNKPSASGRSTKNAGSSLTGMGGTDDNPRYYDSGGASRFFYIAKASRSDRGEGNTHPTVKSTALMRYLVRLVTPPGGTILDPFMGSGSTGVAAIDEGFGFIGIEREAEYLAIAEKRLCRPILTPA